MFCDRLLAAGGVLLLLTGCGAKGPPKPPLSHEPQAARDVNVRQSGDVIEVRWLRPRQRVNGDPIVGPMTFRVMARPVDRTAVPPSTVAPPPGAASTPTAGAGVAGIAGVANADAPPGPPPAPGTAPGIPPEIGSTASRPPGAAGTTSGAAARANEEAFLRDAEVVAEIVETLEQTAAASASGKSGNAKAGSAKSGKKKQSGDTTGADRDSGPGGAKSSDAKAKAKAKSEGGAGKAKPGAEGGAAKGKSGAEGNPAETQYSVLLTPDRFPGTRFTGVRLAIAVVALDARGHRAAARPIIEIDPVETLTPPRKLQATGTPEGVSLSWLLPENVPDSSEINGMKEEPSPFVNVYRAELPTAPTPEAGGPSAALKAGSAATLTEGPQAEAPPGSAAPASRVSGAPTPGSSGRLPRFPYKPIPGSPFRGQAVDRTAVIGTTYLYEARRVSLAPGKGLRESASSGITRIDFTDVFPPGPPTLVTALAAQADGKAAVKIAWSSPIDADVAGYRIYRSQVDTREGKPGVETLIATASSGQTEWTDAAVQPGATYRYSVAAIDGAVPPNESARSEVVDAPVPAETP